MAHHRPSRLGDMSGYICVVHGCSITVTPWYTMVRPTPSPTEELFTNKGRYRLFPFMTVCGALGVVFCLIILILAAQRFLLPGIIIIGSFLLFTLWLTGLIETGLQLYGPQANVNSNCQNYVSNLPYEGNTIEALAWLTQNNICKLDVSFSDSHWDADGICL